MYCWIRDHKGSIEAFLQGHERCDEYFADGMCNLCKSEYQDGFCYTDHTPIKANYPVPAIRTNVWIGSHEVSVMTFDRCWQLQVYVTR